MRPGPDPNVDDEAPDGAEITPYDEAHLTTYLRLLDAEADGADWAEVAAIMLHIDPKLEPERAHKVWQSHLARAQWMTAHGYRGLLMRSLPDARRS
jgi:hypothetical protein